MSGLTTVFRRRISPTEWMYFPMRDMAPPFLMQLAFQGEGSLDPDELRRAVAIAAEACPGARLVRDGDEWVDSGIAPAVRVVAGHILNYARLEEDPVIDSPIGPSPEATCEVLLLTSDPVTVVFRVFHGVMDGAGVALWARSVFRVLAGFEPRAMPDPIADVELVNMIGVSGKPTVMLPRYSSAVGHGRQDSGLARHLLRHRTIHATGSSVVARIAVILAEEAGSESRIMIPVDLRRHDLRLRSTANLALPLFLDVAPGQVWSQINLDKLVGLRENRELNQMANSRLANIPPVIARALLHAINWLGARFGRNLASATVSHLGRFDLRELSVPGFTATSVRMLPQHSVAMPLLFTLAEAGGRTELTVSARNGRGIELRLDALLDRIATELETALPQRNAWRVR
ncbi:peptide synthetase [Nocardia sp. NPDC059246]|uniref:peptide synthetase n=1 Tax=unclassified Nocardia TaxID=2637762 RepID=UPI00368B37EC